MPVPESPAVERLAKAKREGRLAEELQKFPRRKRRSLVGALATKLAKEKPERREIVFKFSGKPGDYRGKEWHILIDNHEQAKLLGHKLWESSRVGLWLPWKKYVSAQEVIETDSPDHEGVWYYLLWDSQRKTFAAQKFRAEPGRAGTFQREPMRKALSADAMDYFAATDVGDIRERKTFPMETVLRQQVEQNPFALLGMIGRNIHSLRDEGRDYLLPRLPETFFEGYALSWEISTQRYREEDGGKAKKKQKQFFNASKEGRKWVVKLERELKKTKQEKLAKWREREKKKRKEEK